MCKLASRWGGLLRLEILMIIIPCRMMVTVTVLTDIIYSHADCDQCILWLLTAMMMRMIRMMYVLVEWYVPFATHASVYMPYHEYDIVILIIVQIQKYIPLLLYSATLLLRYFASNAPKHSSTPEATRPRSGSVLQGDCIACTEVAQQACRSSCFLFPLWYFHDILCFGLQ